MVTRSTKRLTAAFVGSAAAILTVAGLLDAHVLTDDDQKFCGGVGLVNDTTGGSPDAALDAYVLERGGDPQRWRRGDSTIPGEVEYRPRRRSDAVPDLSSIAVEEVRAGVWSATGACV